MTNILSVSQQRIGRPKQYWAYVMIVAAMLLLAGFRISHPWLGWVVSAAGAVLGLWGWFFHRQRVWIVRLNLLLNQRITLLFEDLEDANSLVAALREAKNGALPLVQS